VLYRPLQLPPEQLPELPLQPVLPLQPQQRRLLQLQLQAGLSLQRAVLQAQQRGLLQLAGLQRGRLAVHRGLSPTGPGSLCSLTSDNVH